MPPTEPDPYARLSLRDRLQLLAFEARLAGHPSRSSKRCGRPWIVWRLATSAAPTGYEGE